MYAPNKRVMFVDDEEGVRIGWNRFLSERGFDVTTVEDGNGAVSKLKKDRVDVVVSDLKMPGLDGLQLLAWLKESQPDTRFILLTGYGSEDVEKKARQLGAYEYLNKPISPDALSAIITAALVTSDTKARRQEGETASAPKGGIKEVAKIAGLLVTAPIIGLAFAMFLPVMGFGMLFKVIVEALRKRAVPVRP